MNECIEHRQKGIGLGYGSTSRNNKTYWMHRVVYCESNGLTLDNIEGKVVRHKCDNPRCINPKHLELGTHGDNMSDMTSRNRQAKGETQGSAVLTEEAVRYIRKHYHEYTQRALAKKFKVSQRTVARIIHGTQWKHMKQEVDDESAEVTT